MGDVNGDNKVNACPTSVWFSEFAMPYLITPDKRMSMGEVYTAKFEAGKVFCIEVYDSTLSAEIWLTDENNSTVEHCRTDEGLTRADFYCEASDEYRVTINTYSSR